MDVTAKKYCIGVDIGGTAVKMGFFTVCGKLLEKWTIPTNTKDFGKNILSDVSGSIGDYIKSHALEVEDFAGTGVGVPGPVTSDGVVHGAVNLYWRGDVDVSRDMSELLNMPVKTVNDASAAAIGEMWMGGGSGIRNMVFVTLGTGVGGAVIIDGLVVSGAHGAGGEIGHILINPYEKERCNCGNRGCLEQYVSATGISRMAGKKLLSDKRDSLLRTSSALTSKAIFEAALKGDEIALEVTDEVCDKLGDALAGIACVVDPEVVVIGGGVSQAGELLFSGIRTKYRKYAFPACRGVKIVRAKLGNDAGIYGAAYLMC